jgi:hypothetical protein
MIDDNKKKKKSGFIIFLMIIGLLFILECLLDNTKVLSFINSFSSENTTNKSAIKDTLQDMIDLQKFSNASQTDSLIRKKLNAHQYCKIKDYIYLPSIYNGLAVIDNIDSCYVSTYFKGFACQEAIYGTIIYKVNIKDKSIQFKKILYKFEKNNSKDDSPVIKKRERIYQWEKYSYTQRDSIIKRTIEDQGFSNIQDIQDSLLNAIQSYTNSSFYFTQSPDPYTTQSFIYPHFNLLIVHYHGEGHNNFKDNLIKLSGIVDYYYHPEDNSLSIRDYGCDYDYIE